MRDIPVKQRTGIIGLRSTARKCNFVIIIFRRDSADDAVKALRHIHTTQLVTQER